MCGIIYQTKFSPLPVLTILTCYKSMQLCIVGTEVAATLVQQSLPTQPVTPMLTSSISEKARQSPQCLPYPTKKPSLSFQCLPHPFEKARQSLTSETHPVTPMFTSSHMPDIHSHTSRWDILIASKVAASTLC